MDLLNIYNDAKLNSIVLEETSLTTNAHIAFKIKILLCLSSLSFLPTPTSHPLGFSLNVVHVIYKNACLKFLYHTKHKVENVRNN